MDLRKQDVRYGLATFAAVGFVVYLVIGNFGLVPSPVPGVTRAGPAVVQVPELGGTDVAAPDGDDASETAATEVLPRVIASSPRNPGAAQPPPPADTSAPRVDTTTPDGTTIVVLPGQQGHVEGTAADSGTGVAALTVRFAGDGGEHSVQASLDCGGSSRSFCTWSARVPGVPGRYEVDASASDGAGNRSPADTISVTVVSSAPVTGQGDADDGVVGGLLGAVTGLLGLT